MQNDNYIREIGLRIRSKFDQSSLPDRGLDSLFDSYAVLALAKGEDVTDEDVHNAWSAWATEYDPDSDSLVPFEELSDEMKHEDTRFTNAIHEVSRTINLPSQQRKQQG